MVRSNLDKQHITKRFHNGSGNGMMFKTTARWPAS
jgi:hypothetical protein